MIWSNKRREEKKFLEEVFDESSLVHTKQVPLCSYEFNSKVPKKKAHWSPAWTKDYREEYSFTWKNRYRVFNRIWLYIRAWFTK